MIGVSRRVRLGLFCLLALTLMAPPAPALAKTLFGIVSERSAPALAAGAERFVREHAAHELVLRTPEQVARLSDRELVAHWQEADAVLRDAASRWSKARNGPICRKAWARRAGAMSPWARCTAIRTPAG